MSIAKVNEHVLMDAIIQNDKETKCRLSRHRAVAISAAEGGFDKQRFVNATIIKPSQKNKVQHVSAQVVKKKP